MATVSATPTPALTLVKTATVAPAADQDDVVAGDVVTYSFTVTNSGNTTLATLHLTDPSDSASPVPCAVPAGGLPPGASVTCAGTTTHTITQADVDAGSRSDTASVTGIDVQGDPTAPATSTAEVTASPAPALTIVKSSTTTAVSALGFVIAYSFAVTNSGNVTLAGVGVTDTQAAPASALTTTPTCQSLATPSATCTGATTTLIPGQTATFTATYTVAQADLDNGSISDSATASGTPPTGPAVTSAASTKKIPTLQFPAIAMVKSSLTPAVTKAGDVITYQFVATNTGNVTLDQVGVTDTQIAPAATLTTAPTCLALANPAGTCGGATATLAPNQSATFTATYAVTQADIDNATIGDTATADGTPPQIAGGPAVTPISSSPSSVSVPVAQAPALMIVKSSPTTSVKAVGDVITYQFVATNTGDVSLTGVSVADTQTAPADALGTPVTCQSLANPAGSCTGNSVDLAVGQSATFIASYTVTQADLDHGSVADSAVASGTPPQSPGGPAPTPISSQPSTLSVPVTALAALTLVKQASPTTVTAAGATVNYTFLVTNSGNVTLHGIDVTDAMTAPALDSGLSAIACPIADLAPGAATTCTASYTITVADADNGSVLNTATAHGTPAPTSADPAPVAVDSPTSSAVVTITQAPSLTVLKTSPTVSFNSAGQTITYRFTVTNTGNVTLTGVGVTDTQAVAGSTLATPPTCASLTSPAAACSGSTTSLAPGQVATFIATYLVTQSDVDSGSVSDSAIASGMPPTVAGSPPPVPVTSSPSSASVPAIDVPALSLLKSATTTDVNGDGVIGVGDLISYSFAVTNSGNTTMTGITVSDPTLGAVTCPSTALAPGRSITCTTSVVHTISQADVDAGQVTNSAIAQGTPAVCPCSLVSSDPSSTDVVLTQSPSIGLAKSGTYTAGVIDWLITATNTGNVTLINLSVSDPTAGPVTCASSTLAPGASEVCSTAPYTPTPAELTAGHANNVATATADGVGPTPVSRTASAAAVVPLPSGLAFTDPPNGASGLAFTDPPAVPGRIVFTDPPTVPSGIAFTGSPTEQVLFVGLLMLITGLLLLIVARRRRQF